MNLLRLNINLINDLLVILSAQTLKGFMDSREFDIMNQTSFHWRIYANNWSPGVCTTYKLVLNKLLEDVIFVTYLNIVASL